MQPVTNDNDVFRMAVLEAVAGRKFSQPTTPPAPAPSVSSSSSSPSIRRGGLHKPYVPPRPLAKVAHGATFSSSTPSHEFNSLTPTPTRYHATQHQIREENRSNRYRHEEEDEKDSNMSSASTLPSARPRRKFVPLRPMRNPINQDADNESSSSHHQQQSPPSSSHPQFHRSPLVSNSAWREAEAEADRLMAERMVGINQQLSTSPFIRSSAHRSPSSSVQLSEPQSKLATQVPSNSRFASQSPRHPSSNSASANPIHHTLFQSNGQTPAQPSNNGVSLPLPLEADAEDEALFDHQPQERRVEDVLSFLTGDEDATVNETQSSIPTAPIQPTPPSQSVTHHSQQLHQQQPQLNESTQSIPISSASNAFRQSAPLQSSTGPQSIEPHSDTMIHAHPAARLTPPSMNLPRGQFIPSVSHSSHGGDWLGNLRPKRRLSIADVNGSDPWSSLNNPIPLPVAASFSLLRTNDERPSWQKSILQQQQQSVSASSRQSDRYRPSTRMDDGSHSASESASESDVDQRSDRRRKYQHNRSRAKGSKRSDSSPSPSPSFDRYSSTASFKTPNFDPNVKFERLGRKPVASHRQDQTQQSPMQQPQHTSLHQSRKPLQPQPLNYQSPSPLNSPPTVYPPDDDDEDQPLVSLKPPSASRAPLRQTTLQMTLPNKRDFVPPRAAGTPALGDTTRRNMNSHMLVHSSLPSPAPQSDKESHFITSNAPPQHGRPPFSSTDPPLRFYPPTYFDRFSHGELPNYHRRIEPELTTQQLNGEGRRIDSLFSSPGDYVNFFNALVCQDIQGRLNKLCVEFRQHVNAFNSNSGQGQLPQRRTGLQPYLRRFGIHYYDANSIELTTFHPAAHFNKNQWKRKGWQSGKGKGKYGEEGDFDTVEDEDDSTPTSGECQYYLASLDSSSKERSIDYHEGDLWIISSDQYFNMSGILRTDPRTGQSAQSNPDCFFPPPNRHNFVAFLYSKWHGFASKGQRMLVAPLPVQADNQNTKLFASLNKQHTKIFAIRLSDFGHECVMLDRLNSIALRSTPLLKYILNGNNGQLIETIKPVLNHARLGSNAGSISSLLSNLRIPEHVIDDIRSDILSSFALNTDQARVVDTVANWFWTEVDKGTESNPQTERKPPAACPIQLVHGCFGSGKSYLLVVLILFLTRILDVVDKDCKIKIMVASLTNVAVDGILLGLKKIGINFTRIGSLKKVAPAVIQNMIHVSASGLANEKESLDRARADLRDMLKKLDLAGSSPHVNVNAANGDDAPIMSSDDRIHLERALEELEGQKRQLRQRRLEKARVVGITVAACDFNIMAKANIAYPILLLDEASQMTEPASMIPVIQFKVERLLLVGDPNQLPPILEGTNTDSSSQSSSSSFPWLSRTLFVRLRDAGLPMIQLQTQYRMHPLLAKVPNQLFYENRLTDGVTPDDRYPLLVPRASDSDGVAAKPLPPFIFINVNGSEVSGTSRTSQGSLCNFEEIDVITNLVRRFLLLGLRPSDIGVITVYRSQAFKIADSLAQVVVTPVETQPAKNSPILSKQSKARHNNAQTPEVCRVSGAGVQVSTVDAFQGAEKSVIIFSCVRTTSTHFLDNAQRLNVSLTRARHHLIMIGKKSTLESSPFIQPMIKLALVTPMGFAPNPDIVYKRIMAMRLNPNLLETGPSVDDSAHSNDGDDGSSGQPLALSSLRNLAREQQLLAPSHKRAIAQPTVARNADNSIEEEDFLDDTSPSSHRLNDADEDADDEVPLQSRSSKKRKRRLSKEELAGLSPYEIAHLSGEEKDEDTPSAAPSDDGDIDDGDDSSNALSIHDILAASSARARQKRAKLEANIPDPTVNEGEMELDFHGSPKADDEEEAGDQNEYQDRNYQIDDRANGFSSNDNVHPADVPFVSSSPCYSSKPLDFDDPPPSTSELTHHPLVSTPVGRRNDVQVRSKRRRIQDDQQ